MYNYYENVKSDLKEALEEYQEYSKYDWLEDDPDEIGEEVYEKAWIDDSVTGNGSGSYFFNTYKSEEALCHNLDLLGEALSEFGYEGNALAEQMGKGAEACDVTIRCYILGQVIGETIEEYIEELKEAKTDEEA